MFERALCMSRRDDSEARFIYLAVLILALQRSSISLSDGTGGGADVMGRSYDYWCVSSAGRSGRWLVSVLS